MAITLILYIFGESGLLSGARRGGGGVGVANGYSSLVHGIAVKRGKKLSHSNKSHVSFAHDQLVSQSHVN